MRLYSTTSWATFMVVKKASGLMYLKDKNKILQSIVKTLNCVCEIKLVPTDWQLLFDCLLILVLVLVMLWTSVGWAFSVHIQWSSSSSRHLDGSWMSWPKLHRRHIEEDCSKRWWPFGWRNSSWGQDVIYWRITWDCDHEDHVHYLKDGKIVVHGSIFSFPVWLLY